MGQDVQDGFLDRLYWIYGIVFFGQDILDIVFVGYQQINRSTELDNSTARRMKSTMIHKKPEKIFSGLILGFTFPLLIGLLSIILWFYFDGIERRAIFYLIAGFAVGLLIDLRYLKSWIRNRFDLPIGFVALIYVVYNIMLFGFFMGFPVFNAFLGIFAGYYFGNRICHKKVLPERQAVIINRVSLFTGLVMTFICIASGFLAFTGEGAGAEIKGLLGSGFDITKSMVWAIVIIGGFLLILLQVLLTRITMIRTIKNNIGQ